MFCARHELFQSDFLLNVGAPVTRFNYFSKTRQTKTTFNLKILNYFLELNAEKSFNRKGTTVTKNKI